MWSYLPTTNIKIQNNFYYLVHSENCIFKSNIFNANGAFNNKELITAIAGEKGSCEVIMLNHLISEGLNQTVIKTLYSTAVKENVKIYVGSKKLFLMEFKWV